MACRRLGLGASTITLLLRFARLDGGGLGWATPPRRPLLACIQAGPSHCSWHTSQQAPLQHGLALAPRSQGVLLVEDGWASRRCGSLIGHQQACTRQDPLCDQSQATTLLQLAHLPPTHIDPQASRPPVAGCRQLLAPPPLRPRRSSFPSSSACCSTTKQVVRPMTVAGPSAPPLRLPIRRQHLPCLDGCPRQPLLLVHQVTAGRW